MALMISWVMPVNPSHPYLENDPAPSFAPTICAFHLGFSLGVHGAVIVEANAGLGFYNDVIIPFGRHATDADDSFDALVPEHVGAKLYPECWAIHSWIVASRAPFVVAHRIAVWEGLYWVGLHDRDRDRIGRDRWPRCRRGRGPRFRLRQVVRVVGTGPGAGDVQLHCGL